MRRPALEDLVAVRPRRGRQDRDAGPVRPVAASRPASNSAIAGRNSPDPTRATGSRHAREHIRACATLPGHDPDPAMDARRGDHRLGDRLPRRHDREPRAAGDRQELPTTFLGVLEGQAYVVSGYLAVLAALLILAGALADFYGRRRIFVIGLTGVRGRSRSCAGSPRPSSSSSCSASSRARPARSSSRAPCRSSRPTFEGQARARAFGTWAAATSALTLFGPIRRRPARRHPVLAGRVPHQRPARGDRPLGDDPAHAGVARRDGDRLTSTGSARSSARSPIGGLAFGAIRGQQTQLGGPARVGRADRRRRRASSSSRSSWRRPHPLVPLSLFRIRDFAVINLSTFLIYGALYVTRSTYAVLLPGHARLHGDRRVDRRPPERHPARRPVDPGRRR